MQSTATFLPSDEVIYERSRVWSNFFSRVVSEEDYQEIDYDEIESIFGDEEEDENSEEEESIENMPANGCGPLMKVKKFEASSSSSDDFDHENLLNETRNIIEERKRMWKESGMDRILDTFDFNAITEKVGSWLRKTRHNRQIPSDLSMHEVHYENHQYELNSDDSLQSADTAKYILSNKKPRSGRCTKMIIKKFRYVKGNRKELHNKYNCLDKSDLQVQDVFSKRRANTQQRKNHDDIPYYFDEYRTPTNHNNHYRPRPLVNGVLKHKQCDVSGVMPLDEDYKTPKVKKKIHLGSISKTSALTHEAVRKNRSLYRKRRSDVARYRSTSRSSSCNSDRSASHTRPRYRKFFRKTKKQDSVSSISPDDTRQSESPAQPPAQKVKVNLQTDCKKGINPDVTCFLPENIVNSTAISNKKCVVLLKKKLCELSPVKSLSKKESASSELQPRSTCSTSSKWVTTDISNKKKNPEPQFETTKRKASLDSKKSIDSNSSDKRIVLYNPENETLYNESISRGFFVLTEEYLKKSLGKKQAQRFIVFNKKRFPLKFDLSSTVYFMLPEDSDDSHRSQTSGESDDEDVLNMFGKVGSLVEQTSLN